MQLNLTRKAWISIVTIGLIGVVVTGWFFTKGSTPNQDEKAVTVAATRGPIKVMVSATGQVEPMSSRDVTSKANGAITKINVQNGQRVKKGDLLMELDSASLQSQIDLAILDLRQAEGEIDTTVTQRGNQNVVAPISGQVAILEVSKGQDVQKNSVLMMLQDTSKLTFDVPVNEAQMEKIRVGQKVDVVIIDLFSTLQGRVTKVNRTGVAGTDGAKLYDVTVELNNAGGLAPGLKAEAVVHTAQGTERGYEYGTLDWINTVAVRAGVAGTLSTINVEANDYVKKGQSLALITSDNIDATYASQALKLERARVNLANLQKQLADYRIYATTDGVVNLKGVQSTEGTVGISTGSSSTTSSSNKNTWQVGDDVKMGQTIASIVDEQTMTVTIPVDEVDIAKVKVGQAASITVDALPENQFKGTVMDIATEGVTQNGVASFDVTVTIEQPEAVKTGMTSNVEILVASKDDVLLLPIEAIREIQGKKFVTLNQFKLPGGSDEVSGQQKQKLDGNSGQQKQQLEVKTGLYNESVIEITAGLKEGQAVVLPSVTRTNSNSPGLGMGMGRAPR